MKIGVIGAGRIGANLARQWSRRGHDVMVSYKRDQAALAALAAELGGAAGTPAEAAAHGDVVLLAVPWSRLDEIAEQTDLRGRVVIDTTNHFAAGGLADLGAYATAAERNVARFGGIALVKAFNTYTSGFQAAVGDGRHGRPVAMFYGGEDTEAKKVAERLVTDAGFVGVDIGGWDHVTMMEAPRRPGAVYGEEYRPESAHRIVAALGSSYDEAARLAASLAEG
jgi:8-hydroxy-5-deazaflavin:NADPH oxidoreductase